MTTLFRGYSTDVLLSMKSMGRALVGDDDLYDAAQAYTDPAKGGGIFGPALIGTDAPVAIVVAAPTFPASLQAPGDDADRHGATLVMSGTTLSRLESQQSTDPDAPPDSESDTEDEPSPWDRFELLELRDILKKNEVEFPRTMTFAGAVKRLEDAGITPPPE